MPNPRLIALAAGLAVLCGGAAAQSVTMADVAGTWTGVYHCAQGATALELEISGGEDAVVARFAFAADAANPSVPSGSFMMTGRFDAKTATLTLAQQRWVNQPPGYVMVDMVGQVSSTERIYRGRITTEGCDSFVLKRR
jgi:hypothetical protein